MRDEGGSRRRPGSDRFRDEDWDEDESPRRSRRRPPQGGKPKPRPSKPSGGLFSRLFGGGAAPPARRGRGGIDFGDVGDEYDEGTGGYGEDSYEQDDRSRRRRPSKGRAPREGNKSLMDICMPVFALASLLPRDADGVHPAYQAFREQVVNGMNKIERESADHRIEPEDARQAAYALCFFIDEQVAQSEWREKMQWAAEPLGIYMQQDPEGGINFFRRLEALGEREKGVKEIFLVCLALGYRGKYAEMEATQQAAEIGDIRQKLVRSINKVPLDKQQELFPEAYAEASAIKDDVPPPPRWWMFASIGTVVLTVVLWLVLWFVAAKLPKEIDKKVAPLVSADEVMRSGGAG